MTDEENKIKKATFVLKEIDNQMQETPNAICDP